MALVSGHKFRVQHMKEYPVNSQILIAKKAVKRELGQ